MGDGSWVVGIFHGTAAGYALVVHWRLPSRPRSFDRLAGALSSMLRDVVPDHEKCVGLGLGLGIGVGIGLGCAGCSSSG